MAAEAVDNACQIKKEVCALKMPERETGTVKWFNNDKGYGFIEPDGGGKDVFVHHSNIDARGFRQLFEGQRVEFGVNETPKGLQAECVTAI